MISQATLTDARALYFKPGKTHKITPVTKTKKTAAHVSLTGVADKYGLTPYFNSVCSPVKERKESQKKHPIFWVNQPQWQLALDAVRLNRRALMGLRNDLGRIMDRRHPAGKKIKNRAHTLIKWSHDVTPAVDDTPIVFGSPLANGIAAIDRMTLDRDALLRYALRVTLLLERRHDCDDCFGEGGSTHPVTGKFQRCDCWKRVNEEIETLADQRHKLSAELAIHDDVIQRYTLQDQWRKLLAYLLD